MLPCSPQNQVPKHHTYTSFKYLQGWWLNHFSGQHVPMLDNPLSEEFFPNIQPKLPSVQLETISFCPISCYLGEETDIHLITTSYQVVVESDKISLEPPSLQAKHPHFPQLLLIRLVLQILRQICFSWLNMLQHLNVLLLGRSPKLNTVFEMQHHQCQEQGENHVLLNTDRLRTLRRLSRKSVPVFDHPLGKEKIPNVKSKTPLVQFWTISMHPVTGYQGEKTSTSFSTSPPQEAAESNQVAPQPPFL